MKNIKYGLFWLRNDLFDIFGASIGVSCVGLYAYLARRADKNGVSYPSLKRIRKDLKIGSPNTLSKYISILEQHGLLQARKNDVGKYIFTVMLKPREDEISYSKNETQLTDCHTLHSNYEPRVSINEQD